MRKSEKKKLKAEERVKKLREDGGDVIAYTLANGRAYTFLSEREKILVQQKRADRNQIKEMRERQNELALDLAFHKYKLCLQSGATSCDCNEKFDEVYSAELKKLRNLSLEEIENLENKQTRIAFKRAENLVSVI